MKQYDLADVLIYGLLSVLADGMGKKLPPLPVVMKGREVGTETRIEDKD